jgi:hypothetical protein
MIMYSKPDRSHPLWEFWYLDGVADGRVEPVMSSGADLGRPEILGHVAGQMPRRPFRLPRYLDSAAQKLTSGTAKLAIQTSEA